MGKRIGVVGQEQDMLKEALFLRTYSSHVYMLANYPEDIGEVARKHGSTTRQLDVLYPAMGCDVRSKLAANIGADCDDKGLILVDAHMETSVPNLYAIGDVVKALNQIAVGFGHAALAAAHIHNTLRERSPPVRTANPA